LTSANFRSHANLRISRARRLHHRADLQDLATRIISGGAGLLFKGSGFYITDYGKDGKKDQRAASSSSDSKTDSKPAASPAPKAE